MGLVEILSFFREEGEMGPLALRGWGSGGILAPGETCMLASWAAYSCCRVVEKPARRQHPNPANIQSFIFCLFLSPSLLLFAFISPSLSLTSFLSFHEAGREPPSKVLTVFQRLKRETAVLKTTQRWLSFKILGAPVFHSSQRKVCHLDASVLAKI